MKTYVDFMSDSFWFTKHRKFGAEKIKRNMKQNVIFVGVFFQNVFFNLSNLKEPTKLCKINHEKIDNEIK